MCVCATHTTIFLLMRYIGTYRYLSQISMWERGHLEKVTSKLRLKERIRVTPEFHKSYIRVSYSWRKSKWNENKWKKKRKMESVPGRRKASVEIQRKWKNWYALKTKGYPHLTILLIVSHQTRKDSGWGTCRWSRATGWALDFLPFVSPLTQSIAEMASTLMNLI